jgi:hypothetical protein
MKSYVTLIIVFLFILSCEKNKSDEPGDVENTQRIKLALYDNEGENNDWKSEYSYEENNLSLVIEYRKDEQGIWTEEYKAEFSYNGTNATATWFEYSSGVWEPIDKSEYIIENGLIMQELNFDYEQGQWVQDWKYNYEYNGAQLIAWQSYYNNDNGILIENEKGAYEYADDLLTEYLGYEKNGSGDWEFDDRETFSYSGNELSGWIDYNLDGSDNWIESYKCDYTYLGDNISTAMYFNWDDGINNWETESFSEYYSYNSAGYLTERVDDDGYRVNIEYEEGNGNASLFWYYPEDLVYGKPTFKSASRPDKFVPYYKRVGTLKQMIP